MQTNDLTQLYLGELQEACSFEAQFAVALSELADRTSDPELRKFLTEDGPQARLHGEQLAGLLETHGATEQHEDGSMRRMLREARDWVDQIEAPAVRDAALIAALQRIQHYSMAVHGSLEAWARRLELADAKTLAAMLEDAKTADARLTEIARSNVNAAAET